MSRAIIDQPGLRIVFSGLALSLLLGLILKAQISPDRVQKALSKSVAVLEKDVFIDFERAEVVLSRWGFPLPHLVVTQLRISPKKKFCQNTQVFVDQVEFPLTFHSIFELPVVEKARAGHVEVRIDDDDQCVYSKAKSDKSTEAKSVVASKNEMPVVSEQILSQNFQTTTRSDLKEIFIEDFKLVSHRYYDQPILFKQFKLYINYSDNRISLVEIKSRLSSLKDSRTGVYFLNGNLEGQVKPNSTTGAEISVQLKGRMLDGDVQIFSKFNQLSKKLNYDAQIHKVSFRAFSPFFQKYPKLNIDRWPLSLSFYLFGELHLGASEKAQTLKIKNLELSGENSFVKASDIEWKSPLLSTDNEAQLNNFELIFSHFPVYLFKDLISDKIDFQSIENFGLLDGKFNFETTKYWEFIGQVAGTQFIFSNRGSRELQKIDRFGISLKAESDVYQLKLDDFVLNNTEAVGALEGSFQSLNQMTQIKLNIEGYLFNEKIWQQLTQIKQYPLIKLNWSYKKASDERHQLKLIVPEIQFEGVKLYDSHFDYIQIKEKQNRSIGLNFKFNKAEVKRDELNKIISDAIFNDKTNLLDSVYISQKNSIEIQGSDWKNITFDFDSQLYNTDNHSVGVLKVKGEIKPDNLVTGTMTIQTNKDKFHFDLQKNQNEDLNIKPLIKGSL